MPVPLSSPCLQGHPGLLSAASASNHQVRGPKSQLLSCSLRSARSESAFRSSSPFLLFAALGPPVTYLLPVACCPRPPMLSTVVSWCRGPNRLSSLTVRRYFNATHQPSWGLPGIGPVQLPGAFPVIWSTPEVLFDSPECPTRGLTGGARSSAGASMQQDYCRSGRSSTITRPPSSAVGSAPDRAILKEGGLTSAFMIDTAMNVTNQTVFNLQEEQC
ncbi:hypothetical protein NDU88_007051 [Pleurodeles waltl]|uniref:Uncharacterized protein n=1 Tax=Pleurodeles waltl TaxID=8319 RepID=A0AAV7VT70_PLEWA|nr:hypothetical protein NDU88_007051 [Pleurodeles waltl]